MPFWTELWLYRKRPTCFITFRIIMQGISCECENTIISIKILSKAYIFYESAYKEKSVRLVCCECYGLLLLTIQSKGAKCVKIIKIGITENVWKTYISYIKYASSIKITALTVNIFFDFIPSVHFSVRQSNMSS